jgi:hypothetical protein
MTSQNLPEGLEKSNKSVLWVVVAVMLAIAVFGWGFLAASYEGAQAPPPSERGPQEIHFRGARGRFFANAVAHLPDLPTVMAWHFRNRIWLPLLLLGLEVAGVAGGFVMKRVERELERPTRRSRPAK